MKKLKLLMAACALLLGGAYSANAQSWTASEAAPGSYFLYNVGSGKFLTGGNNWGTHASLDDHGLYCTLTQNNGAFIIATGNGQHLGSNGYVDAGSADWTFTAVEGQTNTYTINNSTFGYLVATSGSTDLSASASAPTDNFGYWKLASRDALLAAANLEGATEAAPVDLTFLLGGVNFVRNCDGWENNPGAKTASVTGGWTYTIGANNFVLCGPSAQGQSNTGCEMWNNTFDLHQTATVPNGKYYVTCDGFGSTNTRIYINNVENAFTKTGSVNSHNFANAILNIGDYTEGGKSDIVTVTGKSITVGVKRSTNAGNEWTVIDNFRLYFVGALDLSEFVTAYETALANAQTTAAKTEPYEAALKTPLDAAIATYGSVDKTDQDALTEATNALADATNAVNNSIAAYADAKAYLDKMGAVLDNTNVYTQEAYDAKYGTWLAGYNAKTLETATAATLNANVAYSTGWHSSNNIDDILLSTWTIGGEQANNYDKALYINTWSTEGATDGSEFVTPFFEYWTDDAKSLGANTIQTKVNGLLPNATYSLTIRARVRQTDKQTKIANGITMKVGDGTAVDISAGAQFNGGQFFIGNFSAVGQADADGVLTGTITVAENSNISWLSFYNAKYTEGEDLSAYIADYKFALETVNKALTDDVAYASMQGALQTAATTYASVDESDKAALIAAKEALEEALAAYNAVVAPLKGSNITAWTTTGNNGNFEVNTWSNEGNTDGSGMTTPFTQNWIARGTSLTDATMSYTAEGLTPGYYKVTALIRSLNEAGGATPAGSFIFANDAIERAYNGTACTNGVYANPVVYGLVGEDGKLTIGVKVIKANVNWVSWKNFVYNYVGTELTSEIADNLTEEARTFENLTTGAASEQNAAVAALSTLSDANYIAAGKAIEAAYKAIDRNFTDLNAAIASKEGITNIGFEAGEYAPYNLTAPLAAAKAINQTSEATSQAEIDAATTALNNVQVNAEEVNAIYWADYASSDIASDSYIHPLGWSNTGYNTRIYSVAANNSGVADNAGISAVGNLAIMMKYNTTYGETEGYTMPLKAGKIYKITFKYCGWGNNPTTNIVLTDPENNAIALAPGFRPASNDGNTNADHWYDYTGYFASTTAGNYVLAFNKVDGGQQQIGIGNIELVSATAIEFADGAVPTYAPGTYPVVKVARTLAADKWATAVYPFAVTIPAAASAYIKVATLDSYENGKLGFSTSGTLEANKPFMIRSSAAGNAALEQLGGLTMTNVAVAAATAIDATAGDASLKGVYATTEITNEATNYVLSNNTIYAVGAAGATINPYRAYIQLAQPAAEGARLTFVIDGEETTGIEGIAVQKLGEGNVYNLNGQRVAAQKKGLYIQNGKKVVVK